MKMRLDRALRDAEAGRTRTEADKLISAGRVAVNGSIVRKGDIKVDPDTDTITLDGRAVCSRRFRYYMMNKPAGVLSATEDRSCETVLDLLPEPLRKLGLSPAGRLDKDAEGLLILTNDGDLIHNIITPKKHVEKRYYVRLRDAWRPDYDERFRDGVVIDDGYRCMPARFEGGETPNEGYVYVCEGKFHQVKRMLAAVGNEVLYLRRLRVGILELDEALAPGEVRELTENEVIALRKREKIGQDEA